MGDVTRVCIGIQARTNSSRFPGKIHEYIGEKTMLEHVVDRCSSAAHYINRHSRNFKEMVLVSILVPYGDIAGKSCKGKAVIIEGPEEDVLTRYVNMAETLKADYIVRVTSDCPLIPTPLIQRHIKVGVVNGYDYCSNVDEKFRTSIDGFDVEFFSKRALQWLNENAKEKQEREHVTLKLRREPPDWASVGTIMNYMDDSHIKYSVDTQDDLEKVRAKYASQQRKYSQAIDDLGKSHVHLF